MSFFLFSVVMVVVVVVTLNVVDMKGSSLCGGGDVVVVWG